MELDEFLTKILENRMSTEGINKVRKYIKEDMKTCGFNYDTTRVESQVFNEDNNYDPRVEILSEAYSDGEIIFIDYHIN